MSLKFPALPIAGVRHPQRTSPVDAIYFDVKRAAYSRRCDPDVEIVRARRADIHRVFEPLTGRHPADVVPTAAVGRRLDVDIGGAILPAGVAWRGVVIRHAASAVIEVLGLDCAGHKRGRR
jgi:hypothetical protein